VVGTQLLVWSGFVDLWSHMYMQHSHEEEQEEERAKMKEEIAAAIEQERQRAKVGAEYTVRTATVYSYSQAFPPPEKVAWEQGFFLHL